MWWEPAREVGEGLGLGWLEQGVEAELSAGREGMRGPLLEGGEAKGGWQLQDEEDVANEEESVARVVLNDLTANGFSEKPKGNLFTH